ncbi:MAG TPA: hypothetical protein VMV93_12695 [Chloroflexota bacterium]|nr:hypothetical protein [Chloroflexota bacterium]
MPAPCIPPAPVDAVDDGTAPPPPVVPLVPVLVPVVPVVPVLLPVVPVVPVPDPVVPVVPVLDPVAPVEALGLALEVVPLPAVLAVDGVGVPLAVVD